MIDGPTLRDDLIDALDTDPDHDHFVFRVGPPTRLATDEAGDTTWRFTITSALDGREFVALPVDISPRAHELVTTQRVTLSTALDFAGVGARTVEIIDVNRHFAEKIHALTTTFSDRPNTRVRDLVDLVLLIEHKLVDAPAARAERIRRYVRDAGRGGLPGVSFEIVDGPRRPTQTCSSSPGFSSRSSGILRTLRTRCS